MIVQRCLVVVTVQCLLGDTVYKDLDCMKRLLGEKPRPSPFEKISKLVIQQQSFQKLTAYHSVTGDQSCFCFSWVDQGPLCYI